MAVIRCQHCGESVQVIEPLNVRTGHASSSEIPREWVIFEGGEQLHRCVDGDMVAHRLRRALPGDQAGDGLPAAG